MSSFHFDKEKYLLILNSEGASAALTNLQSDIIQWEYEAFEGEKGYQPEMWQELETARSFAREIWDIALNSKP
jgi:hypothetical protein